MLLVGQHWTQFSHGHQRHPKENALRAIYHLLDQRHPIFMHPTQLTQCQPQLPKNESFDIISCVLMQYQVIARGSAATKRIFERVPGSTRSTDLGVPAPSQTDQCVDDLVISFIFVESIDEEAKADRSTFGFQVTGHQLVQTFPKIVVLPCHGARV